MLRRPQNIPPKLIQFTELRQASCSSFGLSSACVSVIGQVKQSSQVKQPLDAGACTYGKHLVNRPVITNIQILTHPSITQLTC